MPNKIATKTFWFTADKTRVVPDGDPDAAFLCVRKGSPVDPQVAEHYGIPTEDAADMRTAMPGANVLHEANRAKIEATRRISAEVADAGRGAEDAATGRQVSSMIEGRVVGEVGGNVSASGASNAGTGGAALPGSQAAASLKELQEHSLSGSDLLTGTRAAENAGDKVGGAYEERPAGENREAGANPTPSEMREAGEKVAANAPKAAERSQTVNPPADAGAKTGDNLQPGTQEYTPGIGVAITPEGTERADKTQPGGAGLLPSNTNVAGMTSTLPPATPPSSPAPSGTTGATPQVETSLGEALDKAEDKTNPPSGV